MPSKYRQTVTVTFDVTGTAGHRFPADALVRSLRTRVVDDLPEHVFRLSFDVDSYGDREEVEGVNREALIGVAEWAAAEHAKKELGLPSEWNQGTWLQKGIRVPGDHDSYDDSWTCGTACCIAGKVALDNGGRPIPTYMQDQETALADPETTWVEHVSMGEDASKVVVNGEVRSVSDYAREVLRIDPYRANHLFDGSNDLDKVLTIIRDILEEDAA